MTTVIMNVLEIDLNAIAAEESAAVVLAIPLSSGQETTLLRSFLSTLRHSPTLFGVGTASFGLVTSVSIRLKSRVDYFAGPLSGTARKKFISVHCGSTATRRCSTT